MLATAGSIAVTRHLNQAWNVRIVPIGLGAKHDLGMLEVPIERGMASPVAERPMMVDSILLCAYDTLEAGLGIDHVDGVKIDVQGFELDVLRGMREMLLRDHPDLVVELHQGVDRDAFSSFLADAGYLDPGLPIETGEVTPPYGDNLSYHFRPSVDRAHLRR